MSGAEIIIMSIAAIAGVCGAVEFIAWVKLQIDSRRHYTPAQRRAIIDGRPQGFEVTPKDQKKQP